MQGCTIFYIYFALLCPVAFLGHLKSQFCVFKHFGLTKEKGGFGLFRGGKDFLFILYSFCIK